MQPLVKWQNNSYMLRAYVYPFGCGRENVYIDVYRYSRMEWEEEAHITWPALVTIGLLEAKQFAKGLRLAVTVAEGMNRDVGMFEVKGYLKSESAESTKVIRVVGNSGAQVRLSVDDGSVEIISIKEVFEDAKSNS